MSDVERDDGLNTSSERYFREAYDDVMYSGAVGVYSAMVHRLMERRYRGMRTPVVVELGSGAGQHVPYCLSDYDVYHETDLDPDLGPNGPGERFVDGKRVVRSYADAQDLSEFADGSVDRVIATCLLAHLPDPEGALREWRRVLKPGGHVTIYVPSEPGMLLRLMRNVVMVPKSRKHGQDHLGTVYRDHRNHYPGMRIMVTDVFRNDKVKRLRFPTRFVGWNFSLFEVYDIQKSAD